ncbi:MAG TPA: ATP-binding protein [Lacunisphaera sp.]|jgi:signal transduction histidine kinase
MSDAEYTSKEKRKLKGAERADEQGLRMERLENMGLLATRVAHDLNNMLAPMKMAIPMLRSSVVDANARNLLDSLESTVGRATALVRQILEYADGVGGQLQLVPVQQLLEEITLFVTETFPRSIRIEDQVQGDLWQVNANLSQLHQVLLNLCVNARDAMQHGGTLRLGAENCVLDTMAAAKIEGGRSGSYVVLQVDDTGTGFSPVVMAKIWQPFVTTKKAGKGSGLGLSTIRDIIAHHKGFIHLQTVAGAGTSFRIYLPAIGNPPPKPIQAIGRQAYRPLANSRH